MLAEAAAQGFVQVADGVDQTQFDTAHAGPPFAGKQGLVGRMVDRHARDRKSTRLNSSHVRISYAVFCLQKKTPGPFVSYHAHPRASPAVCATADARSAAHATTTYLTGPSDLTAPVHPPTLPYAPA